MKRVCVGATTALTLVAGALTLVAGVGHALILNWPGSVGNTSFRPCTVVGDVTGDGVPDLVASAPGSGAQQYLSLFSGATGAVVYTKEAPTGYFGYGADVQAIGNYGGASTPDFITAASLAAADTAALFIVEGSTGDVLHTISAPANVEGGFGGMIFLANLTGSATPDFITHAPSHGNGEIYIYNGETRVLAHTITHPGPTANSSFAVSGILGDLNNDGFPEIGAYDPFYQNGAVTNAGRGYIISGQTRAILHTIDAAVPTANDYLSGPFPLADLNNDSVPDYAVAIGSAGTRTPTVAIYSGSNNLLLGSIDAPMASAADWGRSIVTIEDITGDGISDIVIGTFRNLAGTNSSGSVHLYNGATRAGISNFESPGGLGSFFGGGLEKIGDYDGDGISDVAIPAPGEAQGRIYIFTQKGRPFYNGTIFNVGERRIGGTPTETTGNIANFGFEALTIASAGISGANGTDFSLTTNPTGQVVPSGATTPFGVTSVATVSGNKVGQLTVTGTNSASTSINLALEAYERPSGPDTRLAYLAADVSVWLVDTISGDRDVISGQTLGGPVVGAGPAFSPGFSKVSDVLIEDSTNLLVSAGSTITRVNRTTGDRTRVNNSPFNDGAGNPSDQIVAMELEPAGTVLAMINTSSAARISRLNLSTLTAAVVSSQFVGSGPSFSTFGSDMYRESSTGDLLLIDFAGQQLLRINTSTGVRTKLNTGSLPYAISIAPAGSNQYFLGQFSPQYNVLRFDAGTQQTTIFGDMGFSSITPAELDVYGDGTVVAYDAAGRRIYRISPSGTVTVVASPSIGLGPTVPSANYSDGVGLRLLSNTALQLPASNWQMWE